VGSLVRIQYRPLRSEARGCAGSQGLAQPRCVSGFSALLFIGVLIGAAACYAVLYATRYATFGGGLRSDQRAFAGYGADPRLTETVYLDEDLLPLFEHVTAAPAIALAKLPRTKDRPNRSHKTRTKTCRHWSLRDHNRPSSPSTRCTTRVVPGDTQMFEIRLAQRTPSAKQRPLASGDARGRKSG
jgi:hypothetical protein